MCRPIHCRPFVATDTVAPLGRQMAVGSISSASYTAILGFLYCYLNHISDASERAFFDFRLFSRDEGNLPVLATFEGILVTVDTL